MLQTQPSLADLYLEDETAWLDAMAELLRLGSYSSLDHEHLQEYLSDMAISDRRAVTSRLLIVLAHILKWQYQPQKRSGSWKATILHQQFELELHAPKGVLRNHAEEVLETVYLKAVKEAAAETGLDYTAFPATSPFTLAGILSFVPTESGDVQ